MNYLGSTKDNIHINDTEIENGSMSIDGDLFVGGELNINSVNVNSLTIGDPEYTLPLSRGNPGDIIVATTDGSTSEWQPAFEGNARIWQNMFTMTVPEQAIKTTIRRLDQSGIGSRRLERDQFPVGSAVRAYAKGQFTVTNPVDGQFASFKIYLGLQINTEVGQEFNKYVWGGNVTPNTVEIFTPVTGGHFEVEFFFTRISETAIQVNSTSINVTDLTGSTDVNTNIGASFYNTQDVPPIPELPYIFPVAPTDQYFIFGIRQLDASSQNATCILKTEVYTIDLCSSESKVIATSANLTTDHTLLSNLTFGDAGHTQFALLAGRDGGQVLSGGITPLHDLKLKSHSIGLDNVIIRDLKTEFKKDVDMDNNNISNANLISNTDGSIQYNTPSYGLEITTQNNKNLNIVSALDAKLTANNILDISAGSVINLYNGIATQMTIDGSEIGANIPVNMNSNNITNAKDIIDASTNNKIDMATGGFLNSLELSSADEVKIVNTTSNNFISSSSAGLNITGNAGNLDISSVNAGNTIQLNDPSLIGGMSIKSNSVGVLIQENSSTNNLGVSSGSVGMVCNSGQMNIRSTDAGNNLTIAKQNGGNIELDVQTGGGVVQVKNSNLDMNFNGIINCAFIDGLKPSGGLYSESSGFSIPSTNLTETNLLGQGASSGTLAVPANGFSALDAYSFKCSGVLSGGTNDLFTLRLKSLVNGISAVEFGAIPVTLADNGLVDVPWSVTADFTVRSLGVAGVGVLVLSGNFSYSNNNEVVRIYLRTIIDSTNFDTTLSNELQFTFQNDATNPLTSFRIDQSSFTKWY